MIKTVEEDSHKLNLLIFYLLVFFSQSMKSICQLEYYLSAEVGSNSVKLMEGPSLFLSLFKADLHGL